MTEPVPIIRQAGEGDRRSFFGGGLHVWKLLTEDTGGDFFLFVDEMAQGKMTPLHRHPEAAETTYVIEGEILVNVDGVESHLGTGGISYVPTGVQHAFMVVSDHARLLTMQSPGMGQGFYRGASVPSTADSSETVDIPRLQQSAQEHGGVEFLGPPPFPQPISAS